MSVYCFPIQLQRFNFVLTYNLLYLYLYKLFVVGVYKPLKSKLQYNYGHLLRRTQWRAKIPQAGRAVLIFSEFRLRNDNVWVRGERSTYRLFEKSTFGRVSIYIAYFTE